MKKHILPIILYVLGGLVVVGLTAPLYSENHMIRSIIDSKNAESARIDIYNYGNKNNKVEVVSVSSEDIKYSYPTWCQKNNGQCALIQTSNLDNNAANIKLKAKNSGELVIRLLGPDARYENDRYPVFIDYSNLVVNGQTIFADTQDVFYTSPYEYKLNVKNGETVDISVNIERHGFGLSDLQYYNINYITVLSIIAVYALIIVAIELYRKKRANKKA